METPLRFYRSTQEAFKDDDYVCAIKGPYKKQSWFFVYVACAIGFAFVVVLLISEIL